MNKFKYNCIIDGVTYDFFVDTSKGENKIISVNGKTVIEEEYTLSLNKQAYIIYYPIKIKNHTVVISIDDKPLFHEYNRETRGRGDKGTVLLSPFFVDKKQ